MALERVPEFVAGPSTLLRINCTAIRKDMAQPWKAIADRFEDIDSPVAILNVGGVDQDEHQNTADVGDDVVLAALPFSCPHHSL